ncbi:hypothetical protein JS533_006005 [Bifidobacterium amazonense]|uniref:Lipoprotein n=1 Tax=Bifidobacterium amazonense TaxID=2809027 RepID=A0ABS9VV40_9BIFI|nr:hypothetical protein [Bifidobacterium amazonense]MCH9275824.1 hypothetical protein [Bifidobacterium amazonense]
MWKNASVACSRVLNTVILTVIIFAGLAACSHGTTHVNQDASSSEASGGEKIASSMSEYIDILLDSDDSASASMKISDSQRRILERARDSGEISRSDYEQSWADYKNCLVDRGWSEPPLLRFRNGIIDHTGYDATDLSEAQVKRLDGDLMECTNLYTRDVATVYGWQIGNVSLLQDGDAAVVDCLHREHLVDSAYDLAQYRDDFERQWQGEKTELDFSDAGVRGCLAANGRSSVGDNGSDATWRPLG